MKISTDIFAYLKSNFSEEGYRIEDLRYKIAGKYVDIEIDADLMDRICDWAGDRQQKIGYDINYELNDEGKNLDEIIDLFYIGMR